MQSVADIMRESGDLDHALDLAVAPIRVLFQAYLARREGDPDEHELAACMVIERAIEDLETIKAEASAFADRRIKDQVRWVDKIVRELKPGIEGKEVARIVAEFLTGREEDHEDR